MLCRNLTTDLVVMALVDLSERPCSQGVLFVVPVGLDTDDCASHRRRLSKHGGVLKPTRGVASRRGAVTRSATIGLYPANKKTTASADYLSPMKVLPDMAINPLFNYTFQRDVLSSCDNPVGLSQILIFWQSDFTLRLVSLDTFLTRRSGR